MALLNLKSPVSPGVDRTPLNRPTERPCAFGPPNSTGLAAGRSGESGEDVRETLLGGGVLPENAAKVAGECSKRFAMIFIRMVMFIDV